MLDLLGSGYVIDHCISALSKYRKDQAAQFYYADCLKNINQILAEKYGGRYVTESLSDLIQDRREAAQEKTGDEIAMDIIKRAGLKARKGGAGKSDTV